MERQTNILLMKNLYLYELLNVKIIPITKRIASDTGLIISTGCSCYYWLLENCSDSEFPHEIIADMLELVKNTIHDTHERAKYLMNIFFDTAAVS